MDISLRKLSLSVLLITLMVVTSFVAVADHSAVGSRELEADASSAVGGSDVRHHGGKLAPSLAEEMRDADGPFKVYVIVNDREAVNDLLAAKGLPLIAGREIEGIPTVELMEVDTKTIEAMARNPGVSWIMKYEKPTFDVTDLDKATEAWEPEMVQAVVEDYDIDRVHGAVDAWYAGYAGDGIKIAVIDDGFDMAHPDMQGAQARYDGGPYDGWPIAYDDYAADMWASGKIAGWVSDTTTTVTVGSKRGGSVVFDDVIYKVRGIKDIDGNKVWSKSGVFHIGYHPDPALAALFGGPVAVLVVDTKTFGVYDTVYVDVTRDFDFSNDKPCTKGDEISYFDSYDPARGSVDFSDWKAGDGYADYSGGMVYWISDGVNVYPGSDWIHGADFVAGSGDAVAFMGAFYGGTHGTMTSGAALARIGTMGGQLAGMAPEAKLIAIPFTGSSVNAWKFAEYGADGELRTGDEADVVSNSYGWSETAIDAGYEVLDMIATELSLKGDALWFWSSGNGGPGYGTTHTVTDYTSVHVGAGTTMMYRYLLGYELHPGLQKWGDVIPFSNSGPTKTGKLQSEIIASGAYSLEPCPLNLANEMGTVGDGSMHFQIGSGTSHATPTVAGGAALGFQAFIEKWGVRPEKDFAKAVLLASADDMHFDPFKQGAGWLNASTYVDLMGSLGGTLSYEKGEVFDSAALYPGNVYGVGYEMYPNFLRPGESDTVKLTTVNNRALASDVTARAQILLKTKSTVVNVTTKTMGDVFVDITDKVPATTDLLKVTQSIPFEQFDPEMDYTSNVEYWLELHDWIDVNGNGQMGVQTKTWELFRYTVDGSDCNTNMVMIKDPIERTTDGLIARIRAITPMKGIQVSLTIDCYELQTFPWAKLKESEDSQGADELKMTIGPGESKDWFVEFSVPSDAPVGLYAAGIYVEDSERVQCIPVTMNVPATDYEFEFGGESYFDTPYNNQVTGVTDKYWRFEVGDWRMFWVVPEELPSSENAFLVTSVSWEELPTDINVHVLAPVAVNAANSWESVFSSPYGPGYYQKLVASSDEMYMGAGKFGIGTNTGGPKEVIAAPIGQYELALGSPAPLAIVTRCPIISGDSASETFYGTTSWITLNMLEPQTVELTLPVTPGVPVSGEVLGSYDLVVDGMVEVRGGGENPMIGETWPSEPIYQDDLSGSFEEALANAAYTRVVEVQTASSLRVSVHEVSNAPDIDLGVWYDVNMDGVATTDEPFWYVGTGGSDESLTLLDPADGQYLVKVLGYTVTASPGYFSLTILQGVAGASIAAVDLEPLVGTGTHSFKIEYTLPGVPGMYVGAATIGFMGADDMFRIEVKIVLTA